MMSTFVEMEFVERMNEEEGAEGQEAQPSTVPQDFFTSSPQYTLAQDTVYFCDGVRRIDFILAFDDEVHSQDDINNQKKRTEFQASLMKMGLDLEIEPKEESVSGRTTFVKVHAPWNPLTTYAEILHIQVPLKESDLPLVSGSDSGPLHYLGNIHHLKPGAVPNQPDYFTAPFRRSQQDIYPIKDHDVLIPPAVRSQIVHYMLQSPMPQDSTKILNISQMTENGCYTAAYPLHDSESAHPTKNPNTLGDRNTLRREWARAGRSFKEQPLDLVRSYFGEQVGLYFAWLGFYTKMLIFAAIVGLINFLFGVFSKDRDITSGEICNNTIGGSLVMCPQCDQKCTFWRLNDTCETVKTSHMYENPVTIFFAVFMGLWATVFLEFWKRRQASLAYRWDLTAAAEEGDPIRPEYLARCTTTKCNIITMEEEPHMPKRILRFRSCLSGIMVLFWILLILAAILGVVVYRLSIFGILSSSIPNHVTKIKVIGALLTPDMVTTITASILNIVIILLLNKGYNKLALVLTDLEMPKTQGEYEYRLTFKKFLFQFVNFYSASFYIAFFKGKFIGFPGSYTYFGKWRIEECSPNGCLFELTSQLAVIMVVKQMVGNFQEVIIPWFSNWWAQRQAKLRPEAVYTRWEQDMDLQPQSPLGLFDEYLEMVIQFGFVTLFVASFPLAPLLALLNNIIEVRVDAWKLVTKMRRPVVSRASGIGAWADILSIVATLSVITNSCILAFTTDIIPRLVYYYGYSADYGTGSPTMHGYTEDSLSIFKISDFKEQNRPNILPAWFDPAIHTTCRYPGYRYPPDHPQAYSITKQYWKVLMAKLAFVIVMQHVVLLTKACIAYIIPDTPSHVRACMRRERFVVQTMLQQAELGRLRNTLLTDAPSSPPSPQFHVENEQAGMGLRRCPLHAESPGVSHPPQRCHMENDQAKKTGDDSLLKGSVEESSSEDSSTVFYSV